VNCQLCDNTGWRDIVDAQGVHRAMKCNHGRNGAAPAGGFAPIGSLAHRFIESLENAALTPNDRQIGEIIRQHVGRQDAIRGRDLAVKVWPEEMQNPAKYETAVRRWLDESIRRLRRFGHLPVAASKANPMGYYIPATDEEGADCHDRLFREGIERIRDSQLFKRDADLMQALRGQLELQGSGFGDQGLAKENSSSPSPQSLELQGSGFRDQGLGEKPKPQSLNPSPCSPPEAR
jgi:hypothetical protein